MSLIKHLEENINGSVSYDYAISVGRAYKTKNGGSPKIGTIDRKLRALVADKKLEPIRNGNVIVGYKQLNKKL